MFNLREFLGLGYYTSEIDEFLAHFDKTHPGQSASQKAEIGKYRRIYNLRDRGDSAQSEKTFWEGF